MRRERCEKIGSMVYHVIPAEAGIQYPQGDIVSWMIIIAFQSSAFSLNT